MPSVIDSADWLSDLSAFRGDDADGGAVSAALPLAAEGCEI